MDDTGSHEVGRIRVDFFEECRAKPNNLHKGNGRVGTLWWLRRDMGPPLGNALNKHTVTLALVISVSIGCFALKMFCTSCWGL